MRLLVTRPGPEAETLAETLRISGHEVIVEPMLVIRPTEKVRPQLEGVDALVATSINAIRAISSYPDLAAMCRLPLYAVGAATAEAGRHLGFSKVIQGDGSADTLLPVLTIAFRPGTRLLHLAGDVVAVDLATLLSRSGIALDTTIVYESVARSALSETLVAALRQSEVDGVILMSPRTAATFVALVTKAGLADKARRLVCFCISGNTASALANLAPRAIRVAEKPDLPSLLALIDREKPQLPGRA